MNVLKKLTSLKKREALTYFSEYKKYEEFEELLKNLIKENLDIKNKEKVNNKLLKIIYWTIEKGYEISNTTKNLLRTLNPKINKELLDLFYEKNIENYNYNNHNKYETFFEFYLKTGSKNNINPEEENFEKILPEQEDYIKMLKLGQNFIYTAEKTNRKKIINIAYLNRSSNMLKKLILFKYPKELKTGSLNILIVHFENLLKNFNLYERQNNVMNINHLSEELFFSENIKYLPYHIEDSESKDFKSKLTFYINNLHKLSLQLQKSLLKELYLTADVKKVIDKEFPELINILKNEILIEKAKEPNKGFLPEEIYFEKKYLKSKTDTKYSEEIPKSYLSKYNFSLNNIEPKFFEQNILINGTKPNTKIIESIITQLITIEKSIHNQTIFNLDKNIQKKIWENTYNYIKYYLEKIIIPQIQQN